MKKSLKDQEQRYMESIEEQKKYQQEYVSDFPTVIILDDINGKEMNDPRVLSMFKRRRHSIKSIFIFNQDYHELPKRTIRANGNIYHI